MTVYATALQSDVERVRSMMRDRMCDSGPVSSRIAPSATIWTMLERNRLLGLCDARDETALDDYKEAVWSANAQALFTIHRLSAVLRHAGLPHVFIKGPLLAQQLYGDYFFRMSTDVDVLLAVTDVAAAIDLLSDMGHTLSANCEKMYWRTFMGEQHFDPGRPEYTTVDLHSMIRHPAGHAPRLTRNFIEGRVDSPLGRSTVFVPSSVDRFFLSAIYLLKALLKGEPAGSHVLDLAMMHVSFDDDERASVRALAAQRSLVTVTGFALNVVASLLGPDDGKASSVGSVLWRRLGGDDLWVRILQPSLAPPISRPMCVAASCDGLGDCLGSVTWEVGRKVAQKACHAGLF